MCNNKGKIRVLFVCTGNSCRSQMAQGWARNLKGDIIDAYSAGIWPVPVNQRAVKVMKEAGIDISEQRSKHIDDLAGVDFDCVVTVCDYAQQQCPTFSDKTRVLHKSIEDPSFFVGTEEEIMAAFRKNRDEIKDFIINLANTLQRPSKPNSGKRD